MKNIFLPILFLLSLSLQAQVVVEVAAKPQGNNEFISNVPSFSFTEPIKLVIDVSGVPNLVGVEPIYIWGFIPGCCGAPTNGDFCDSNEASIMTQEGPNLWSITIPSVKSYMGVGYKQARDAAVGSGRPADETRFGFLVKRDNGCGGFQSNDMEIPFTGPVYIKTEFEVFPLNPADEDLVTLIYNQDLETDEAMAAQTEVYMYAVAYLVGGASIEPFTQEEVGNEPSLRLAKNGTRYTIRFIPREFFGVTGSQRIERMEVQFRSKDDPAINFGDQTSVRLVRIK